ncbi:MAG: diguanylate cyclase [Phycisphaerae bacterium]|nr:diguanylate cyclase [Phycisphaerae bacterium]
MSKKTRKILAIDDDSTSLAILEDRLQSMDLQMISAKDANKGMEMAVNEQPDLILLDIVMPDIDGFELCRQLKADNRTSSIPIIFISAKNESVDKIEGLDLGAIDYVTKPFDIGELRARIGVVLRIIELQEKNLSLANTDELTGLINRRHFFDIFEREVLMAKMKNYSLALLMLDIDHFKSINDTYGHLSGDAILEQMGKILRENQYPLDVVARYGGEEFLILMPETHTQKAVKAADRLRGIIDRWEWKTLDNRISITTSIGLVASASNNIANCLDMVKKADAALYAAKQNGRNCVICWEQVNGEVETNEPKAHEFYELQTKIASLTGRLRTQAMGTVSALEKAMSIAVKDPYIALHSRHVQIYAVAIAKEMNLSDELIERIGTAALLHDLGKMGIPDYIFSKTDALSQQEWNIIKQHPASSVQILAPTGVFNQELQIIRHHHERFDGTGYPDGLKDKEIEIGARVLAVADTFDAITSDRLYKNGQTYESPIREICDCSGSQFDPEVVEAFWDASEKYKAEWPLSSYDSSLISIQEPLLTKT